MTTYTPNLDVPYLEEGEVGGETVYNEAMQIIDVLMKKSVADIRTSPPTVSNGYVCLVAASGTSGDFVGHEGEIAYYFDGWDYLEPPEGWTLWIDDENELTVYDGTNWLQVPVTDSSDDLTLPGGLTTAGTFASGGEFKYRVSSGITASTTHSQGEGALSEDYNVHNVTTVANTDDTVTMPSAAAGRTAILVHNGVNQLRLYPASGDKFLGLSVNGYVPISAAKTVYFIAVDSTTWAWVIDT